MHPSRHSLFAAVLFGLASTAPVSAQETAPATPESAPPAAPDASVPAGTSPAAEAPTLEPAPEAAPGAAAPAEPPAAPAGTSPAAQAPTLEPAPGAAAPDAGAPGTEAPAASEPEITVTKQGDWDVGCVAGTTNCEMQQVAQDDAGNPVVLVRVVKLPEAEDAEALAVFNTPLGTLLPAGLGFQIDGGETGALPFEWCVQEGCIVRLGLRAEDVAALKRGRAVNLRVASIAEPEQPVGLTLSLTGFTAAYDSLGIPPTPPATAQPAPALQE